MRLIFAACAAAALVVAVPAFAEDLGSEKKSETIKPQTEQGAAAGEEKAVPPDQSAGTGTSSGESGAADEPKRGDGLSTRIEGNTRQQKGL